MNLAELSYDQVKSLPPFEVAVLPLGATEPHNLHLPYGTDTIQVDVIGTRACALATDRGAKVVMLPALHVWNIMRAVAGGMIYAAAWLQIVNIGLTVFVDTRARQKRVAEKDARSALTQPAQPVQPEPAS